MSEDEAWNAVYRRSRDNSRTPMQWNGGKNGGFSEGENTWLKVNPNYQEINVEIQEKESLSVLNFYKSLLRLRREGRFKEVLVHGQFQPYEQESKAVIAYERILDGESLITFCNFQNKKEYVKIPEGYVEKVMGNYDHGEVAEGSYCLRPYECISFYRKQI